MLAEKLRFVDWDLFRFTHSHKAGMDSGIKYWVLFGIKYWDLFNFRSFNKLCLVRTSSFFRIPTSATETKVPRRYHWTLSSNYHPNRI